MDKKEQQWEGFQEFHQSSSSDQNKNNTIIIQSQQNVNNQKNTVQKEIIDHKQETSPYKKNKIKIKLAETSPVKQQQNCRAADQDDNKIQNANDSSSPNKTNNYHRLQRIPIMRKQDEYRYVGNVIYRSFAPRSSDTYFRTLKEVDYNTISQVKFRGSETFQFNSKIQSGNLGAVFQGWRVLI